MSILSTIPYRNVFLIIAVLLLNFQAPEVARLCPVVHTPYEAMTPAMALLDLQPHDLFLDLGSGDGRVVFAAAQHTFVRAIGVELNPVCLKQCRAQKEALNLSNAEFWERDMFTLGDHSDELSRVLTASSTTKVFVYATQLALRRLSPLLYALLNQGATVLTYSHHLSIRPRGVGLRGLLQVYHSKV